MAQSEEKKEEPPQSTILVTGANKGIGLALCQMLVTHKQFHVIVACRNFKHIPKPKSDNANKQPDNYEVVDGQNESSQTRIQILKNLRFKGIQNVDFLEMDITDKQSVQKAAQQIQHKYKTIDILINNAGMAFKGNAFDSNVVQTTLQTNYFGTVNVTQTFLPLIKDNGRILMTSSRAGTLPRVIKDKAIREQLLKADLTKNELEKILDDFQAHVAKDKTLSNAPYNKSAYGMSKVAMSAYSRIIAAQVVKRKVFVAAYCPGWCQTYMSSGGGARSPENGAKGLELLCLEKKTMNETGKFWGVKFADEKNDNNTGQLENYAW
eukprot:99783_1